MREILDYLEEKNIPVNDFQAYQKYYNYNDVYNKLLLSQLQGLDCAPVGIVPTEYPVIIKPIINLYGMSQCYKKINSREEYDKENNYGMFWQKYLDGIQYNIDIVMNDGNIIQYFTVESEPDSDGRFKYHKYIDYTLNNNLINFIEETLAGYSGFVNIEVINNYIIEMHLRLNGDTFLYSKQNIDDMIQFKETIIQPYNFFPVFAKDSNNINWENINNIDFDMDDSKCGEYYRFLYFRHLDFKKGLIIQKNFYK